MSGKQAKRIRRLSYGDTISPRVRDYGVQRVRGGNQLHAGLLRRQYQAAKRAHTRGDC